MSWQVSLHRLIDIAAAPISVRFHSLDLWRHTRKPITMEVEHGILNHYNLTNAFPTTWPTEKDESDESEPEKAISGSKNGIRRSKSRYSALERSGSDGRRSLVPGSQKLRDGQEALVQKDEADPLGASDSVVRTLRQKGLPVEEDFRLSKIN